MGHRSDATDKHSTALFRWDSGGQQLFMLERFSDRSNEGDKLFTVILLFNAIENPLKVGD